MNIPNFTPKHDTFEHWEPVRSGKTTPDEYQSALIAITQKALDAGLFYVRDVYAYVKDRADFIPPEAWDMQFERLPSENGVMGHEIYYAQTFIRDAARRAANAEAAAALPVGLKVGTLCVNGKKYTGLTVTEYKNDQVYLVGKAGRYTVTVWTEPSTIEAMKARAIERGWRRS